MKTCTKCARSKPESGFHGNRRGGLQTVCKRCASNAGRIRAWRKSRPETVAAEARTRPLTVADVERIDGYRAVMDGYYRETETLPCVDCRTAQPWSAFDANALGRKHLTGAQCKPCTNVELRERYAADPEYASGRREHSGGWTPEKADRRRARLAASPEAAEHEREKARQRTASNRTANLGRPLGADDSAVPKRCVPAPKGCGRELTRGDFYRDHGRPDGRNYRCKDCDHRRNARRCAEYRDRILCLWDDEGLHACFYCGCDFSEDNPPEIEHFYPESAGGPTERWNLVPSCEACNRGPGGKFDKDPWEFLAARLAERGTDFAELERWLTSVAA